jgi:hypothetical protein
MKIRNREFPDDPRQLTQSDVEALAEIHREIAEEYGAAADRLAEIAGRKRGKDEELGSPEEIEEFRRLLARGTELETEEGRIVEYVEPLTSDSP